MNPTTPTRGQFASQDKQFNMAYIYKNLDCIASGIPDIPV